MSNATNTLNVTNTLENYEELNESGFTNSQSNALATVMESSMQSILSHMDKRFDENDRRLEERFALIDKRFDENDRRLEERFEAIDKRFEAIDRRFEAIDKRLDERFTLIDHRFDVIDKRFDENDRHFNRLHWLIPIYVGLMTTVFAAFNAVGGFWT